MYSRRSYPPIGRCRCCAPPLRSRLSSACQWRHPASAALVANNRADSCRTTPTAGHIVIAFLEKPPPHRPETEPPLAAGMLRPINPAPPPGMSASATRSRSAPDISSAKSSSGARPSGGPGKAPIRSLPPGSGDFGCWACAVAGRGRSGGFTTFCRNWPGHSATAPSGSFAACGRHGFAFFGHHDRRKR